MRHRSRRTQLQEPCRHLRLRRVRGTCRGTSGCELGKQLEPQQQRCSIRCDGEAKDLEANRAPPAKGSEGLAGAQAARVKQILDLVPGTAAGEGGASSSAIAAAAATPMQIEIPSDMKQVLMASAPSAQEARDFFVY